MGKTLLQKVWDAHAVRQLPTGQTQLFIGLHLVHEVTSPQAFDMLRARGWTVAFPDRTFATVDHIVPTTTQAAAVPRHHGRADDHGARAQLPRARDPALRSRQRAPGHRARHRPGARAHATRHDHRLWRQPHVHPRGVRLGGVRHRDLAGPGRARQRMPGDGAAEGAPHQRHWPRAARRLREGRHSDRSSSGSASRAARATRTSMPATRSSACPWTSG